MTKILFIDFETGGLDPQKHSALTIGLAAYVDGEVLGWEEHSIKLDTYQVEPFAMSVNGINLAQFTEGGRTPEEITQAIKDFVARFDLGQPTVGGHNVGFDLGFLKQVVPTYREFLSYRSVDTHSVAQALRDAGMLDIPNLGLKHLAAFYGVELNENQHHTSGFDARATAQVYGAMVKALRSLEGDL